MNNKLKQMIYERGFKQVELAKHLGISESHISLLLNRKRRMNIDNANQLSTFMGVSIDDIYSWINSESES